MPKEMTLAQLSKRCPPPREFRPAGAVRNVKLELYDPPFAIGKRASGARAAGIRYEKKAQKHFEAEFPHHYVRSPWFTFDRADEKRQWCQPDGLLVDIRQGRIIIIEIKLQHTSNSWWQTRQLYQPVVQSWFGTEHWQYSICEVVRWYDPDAKFPERYKLVPDPTHVEPNKFGVHIWRDR